MEFYIDKLLKVVLIMMILQIIISILQSRYYIKGLKIQGEKVFKSPEAKEKAIMINRNHIIIAMIIYIHTILYIAIPLIKYLWNPSRFLLII